MDQVGGLVPIGAAPALLPAPVAESTIRTWLHRGLGGRRLAYFRIGGRIYIDRNALLEFAVSAQMEDTADEDAEGDGGRDTAAAIAAG